MIMPCADAANGHAVTATRLMKWKKKSSDNIVYQSKKVEAILPHCLSAVSTQ